MGELYIEFDSPYGKVNYTGHVFPAEPTSFLNDKIEPDETFSPDQAPRADNLTVDQAPKSQD